MNKRVTPTAFDLSTAFSPWSTPGVSSKVFYAKRACNLTTKMLESKYAFSFYRLTKELFTNTK
jgi:hypothetical protein